MSGSVRRREPGGLVGAGGRVPTAAPEPAAQRPAGTRQLEKTSDLLEYVRSFRAAITWGGHGSKGQIHDVPRTLRDVDAHVAKLDQTYGKDGWVFVYGGDPAEADAPDIGVIAKHVHDTGHQVLALQSDVVKDWGGVQSWTDAVHYVPTTRVPGEDGKEKVMWGGFLNGRPVGPTGGFEMLMKEGLVKGTVLVGGGPICVEELDSALRHNVPATVIRSQARFPADDGNTFGALDTALSSPELRAKVSLAGVGVGGAAGAALPEVEARPFASETAPPSAAPGALWSTAPERSRERLRRLSEAEIQALEVLRGYNPTCILRVGSFARAQTGRDEFPRDVDLVVVGDRDFTAELEGELPPEVEVHFLKKDWVEKLSDAAASRGPRRASRMMSRASWMRLHVKPQILGAALLGANYTLWGIRDRERAGRTDPAAGTYWMHQVLHGEAWWTSQREAVQPMIERVDAAEEARQAELASRPPVPRDYM